MCGDVQENVWGAFRQFEVLLAEPTRSLEEVQKAVDEWYGRLPFRPNFRAELDMSKALHTYVPFWHFACNTACQYQVRLATPARHDTTRHDTTRHDTTRMTVLMLSARDNRVEHG
jgi:hypothetical protein